MAKDAQAADRGHGVERLQTFGASALDDQIDGLTVTLDTETNGICVIDETTHYGT